MTQTQAQPSDQDGYAGDVTSVAAWEMLSADRDAVLIDIRTDPEWRYVGVPDLGGLNKQPVFIPWQTYPGLVRNPNFATQIGRTGVAPDTTLLLLCRSGVRSKAAAKFLTKLGYGRCFNVSDGFEGDLDDTKHRNTRNGWRQAGLPWRQS